MKKVLLTGATGFVGQNATKQLKNKYDLFAIGSKDYDLRVQTECDRLLGETRPDVIIHIAGTVGGIGANKENPGKFLYENLIMGANLIDKAKENNISKFIMLGTVCSYPKFTEVPFKEKDLWLGYPEETNAPYGIAKKTLMKMIETYHEQYGFNGINLIPANMYGPCDHFNLTTSHVIPAMILKVKKAIDNKEKYIELWGTGQASREFLYVDDCVDAIEMAIEKNIPPFPVNIGTGKEIKISMLAETVCEIMGFDGDIKYDNSKPDGQPRRSLDVSLAKELLNFEAKTSLKEGLKKTFDWFTINSRG